MCVIARLDLKYLGIYYITQASVTSYIDILTSFQDLFDQ